MTNSIPLRGQVAPVPFQDPPRTGAPSSPLALEVTRLRAEVQRVESALHMRDHATALVLHEVRQPLNVLVLEAAYLGRAMAGAEKTCLDRIRGAAAQLDELVAHLSDTSFLASGRFALDLTSTDVTRVVADAVARFDAKTSIAVEGEIPLALADARRVDQVLTNLLSNARKYGTRETSPCVSIARRDDDVVVTVLNDGPSLGPDERSKIFEAYYRGRERPSEAKGLGLGLYICRRLVEEHGGRIWTDGDAHHTRFSFSLPILVEARGCSETRLVAKGPSTLDRDGATARAPLRAGNR